MKIDGISLDELMLGVVLGQFKSVPFEAEIDYTFSREFQEQIHHAHKKSKSTLWRFWQTPANRAILIVVLAAVLVAAVAFVFPGVRHAVVDYFRVDEPAVHIPQVVETYYIPTYEPEGFTLLYRDRYADDVIYLWENENHATIEYRQELITSYSGSNQTNTETENRTTKNINGFSIDIISRGEGYPFSAEWTDGRYNYHVSIPSSVSEPYKIFEALVNSLIAVGATD